MLMGVVTPVCAPAARVSRSACLMTPRSAPSVRLKCVYHWYLVRLVRIACWGLGMRLTPKVDWLGALFPSVSRFAAQRRPATATPRPGHHERPDGDDRGMGPLSRDLVNLGPR